MKHFLNIICLIFSLSLVACKQFPFRKETKEFKAFLQDNYQLPLAEKAVYLLVPSCQCRYCVSLDADQLLTPASRNDFYLISSLDTANFKHFKHTLYDEKDRLMKLSFLNYTNQLVLVNNGHIQGVVPVYNFAKQIDSLQSFFLSSL